MNPTAKFRWLELNMGQMRGDHPTAQRIADTSFAIVIQQWWESDFTNIPGEWRDIPVVAAG